jgi:predicted lipoprotein with Yx(FWY)xxD motif
MLSRLLLGAAALAFITGPALAQGMPTGIKTMTMAGRTVLTDAKGMTLYTYDKDTGGKVTCVDKCAAAWPPAVAPTGATATGDFTLVQTPDGKQVWAYDGKPLYAWAKDTKPGDATGDGVGGVWHLAVAK